MLVSENTSSVRGFHGSMSPNVSQGHLACIRASGAGFYPRPSKTESGGLRDDQVPLGFKNKSPLKN